MGQSGGNLRCSCWTSSGLCAAGPSSHGAHHSGQSGRICAKESGPMAQEERRMGELPFSSLLHESRVILTSRGQIGKCLLPFFDAVLC